MSAAGSRYLTGNFAPVTEEVTAIDLEVVGQVPVELEGRLLRNGPNPLGAVDPATYHWFSGTGMVHGVRLRGGRAEWYRNRWVRSSEVTAALGEPSVPGPRHGGMDFSANTNVIGHAGGTYAIVEAGANPVRLSFELDTEAVDDLGGPGGFTAHPKRDPETGELFAMAYHWAWGDVVKYLVVGADGRVRKAEDIDVGGALMLHDMGLTATRAIVMDFPVTFNLEMAASGKSLPYAWEADRPARIGVLPREGTGADVQWCDVEQCYVFHPLNAYDLDDGRVVIDVARHPKMFASDRLGPNEGRPTLWRWTIDPASGKVLEEQLDDRGLEFPRHDERLVGRRHRYGYFASFGDGIEHGPLVKWDLDAGTSEVHHYGPGRATLEAVFVPRPGGVAEDDGWVMSYVYDATTDTSDVVILDARDVTAEPVATIHLPVRVPFGFHGNWVPDDLTPPA